MYDLDWVTDMRRNLAGNGPRSGHPQQLHFDASTTARERHWRINADWCHFVLRDRQLEEPPAYLSCLHHGKWASLRLCVCVPAQSELFRCARKRDRRFHVRYICLYTCQTRCENRLMTSPTKFFLMRVCEKKCSKPWVR